MNLYYLIDSNYFILYSAASMNQTVLLNSIKIYLIVSIRQAEDLLNEGNFRETGKYSKENIQGSLRVMEEVLYMIESNNGNRN